MVLALAACQTPAELKASATVQHAALAAAGQSLRNAVCLQRGYEDMTSFLATRLTPLGSDSYELVVRNDTLTRAVLEVRPGVIEYWIDESFSTQPRAMVRGLLASCR